jgi:hypothetical protein
VDTHRNTNCNAYTTTQLYTNCNQYTGTIATNRDPETYAYTYSQSHQVTVAFHI